MHCEEEQVGSYRLLKRDRVQRRDLQRCETPSHLEPSRSQWQLWEKCAWQTAKLRRQAYCDSEESRFNQRLWDFQSIYQVNRIARSGTGHMEKLLKWWSRGSHWSVIQFRNFSRRNLFLIWSEGFRDPDSCQSFCMSLLLTDKAWRPADDSDHFFHLLGMLHLANRPFSPFRVHHYSNAHFTLQTQRSYASLTMVPPLTFHSLWNLMTPSCLLIYWRVGRKDCPETYSGGEEGNWKRWNISFEYQLSFFTLGAYVLIEPSYVMTHDNTAAVLEKFEGLFPDGAKKDPSLIVWCLLFIHCFIW